MNTIEEVMRELESKGQPGQIEGMARFGITGDKRLGVKVPDMRALAKKIKKDHELALDLWKTGIPDAMIVASMIDDPQLVTEAQMEEWVKDFQSWDVCDQVCMNLFDKTPFAVKKIKEWSHRDEEFVKRGAFALIACVAWHDKTASDDVFIDLLPIIKRESTDDRNFVKKAVNWALRHIGKRNKALNKAALKAAYEIKGIDSKAARWIAADAIRELESAAIQTRLKK
jgi:3-methyladenine DNA glycosylase AlkD